MRTSVAAVAALAIAATTARAQDETTPRVKPGIRCLKLLRAHDYKALEKELADLRSGGRLPRSYRDQLHAELERLVAYRSIKADLDDWCEKSPRSWFPFLVRGELLGGLAWDARGSGWASTVTPEGSRIFKERLEAARKDLEKAHSLEPRAPHPSSELIRVAAALGLGEAVVKRAFDDAVEADPTYMDAYETRIQFLDPRWGGTREGLLDFARHPGQKIAADPASNELVLLAHRLLAERDPKYMASDEVKKEMQAAAAALTKAFPDSGDMWRFCADMVKNDRDPSWTMKFLEKSARCGDTASMYDLFMIYGGGTGQTPNPEAARKWLLGAAIGGEPVALAHYGRMKETGQLGVEKDEKGAIVWYRRAAEAETSFGQFALGHALLTGLGGDEPDPKKGLPLMEAGASSGFVDGMKNLVELYERGMTRNGKVIVAPDEALARKWRDAAQAAQGAKR